MLPKNPGWTREIFRENNPKKNRDWIGRQTYVVLLRGGKKVPTSLRGFNIFTNVGWRRHMPETWVSYTGRYSLIISGQPHSRLRDRKQFVCISLEFHLNSAPINYKAIFVLVPENVSTRNSLVYSSVLFPLNFSSSCREWTRMNLFVTVCRNTSKSFRMRMEIPVSKSGSKIRYKTVAVD